MPHKPPLVRCRGLETPAFTFGVWGLWTQPRESQFPTPTIPIPNSSCTCLPRGIGNLRIQGFGNLGVQGTETHAPSAVPCARQEEQGSRHPCIHICGLGAWGPTSGFSIPNSPLLLPCGFGNSGLWGFGNSGHRGFGTLGALGIWEFKALGI